jgi:hypothetical protein
MSPTQNGQYVDIDVVCMVLTTLLPLFTIRTVAVFGNILIEPCRGHQP